MCSPSRQGCEYRHPFFPCQGDCQVFDDALDELLEARTHRLILFVLFLRRRVTRLLARPQGHEGCLYATHEDVLDPNRLLAVTQVKYAAELSLFTLWCVFTPTHATTLP